MIRCNFVFILIIFLLIIYIGCKVTNNNRKSLVNKEKLSVNKEKSDFSRRKSHFIPNSSFLILNSQLSTFYIYALLGLHLHAAEVIDALIAVAISAYELYTRWGS